MFLRILGHGCVHLHVFWLNCDNCTGCHYINMNHTTSFTRQNVLPVDLDIFISIASCLFVEET